MPARDPERDSSRARPHVVNDKQALAVSQSASEGRLSLNRRAHVSVRAKPNEQLALRSDNVHILAERDPEHAVRKVSANVVIARDRCRQDGLPDPALAMQPEPWSGHAERPCPLAEKLYARDRQLTTIHETQRQRWNVNELPLIYR